MYNSTKAAPVCVCVRVFHSSLSVQSEKSLVRDKRSRRKSDAHEITFFLSTVFFPNAVETAPV